MRKNYRGRTEVQKEFDVDSRVTVEQKLEKK